MELNAISIVAVPKSLAFKSLTFGEQHAPCGNFKSIAVPLERMHLRFKQRTTLVGRSDRVVPDFNRTAAMAADLAAQSAGEQLPTEAHTK